MTDAPEATAGRTLGPGPEPVHSGRMVSGVAFGLITALTWATWLVWTRQAMIYEMPVAWVGLLRNGGAAILLAPFWLRAGILPKGVPIWLLALMVFGAGPGFVLSVGIGTQLAPVAQVSVIMSGATPIIVAIFGYVLHREHFSRSRLIGIAVIIVALAAINGAALLQGEGLPWIAMVAGLSAATSWAVYTFTYPRTGLTPLRASALVGFWSTVLFIPPALFAGIEPLTQAEPTFLIGQLLAQGVLPIAVALVMFSETIKRLGPSRAAMFGGLVPAVVALMAVPVVGEPLEPRIVIGVALAFVGVSLASGALRLGDKRR